MKLFCLFFIGLVCSNQVAAGGNYDKNDHGKKPEYPENHDKDKNDNGKKPEQPEEHESVKKCEGQSDSHSCKAQSCHWHIGHCTNTFNCTSLLTPEDCSAKEICIQKETDYGSCSAKVLPCAYYDYDQCIANSNTCIWTSNFSCEAVPGFVTNCPAKTIQECRDAEYCSYTAKCYNNYYPYKSWCLNKEDCQANQYSEWRVLHPAYCVDNVHFCADLNIDDCKAHAEHCVVERYYDDCKQNYNQCSNNNNISYKEKCIALQYGCENLSIENCSNSQFCKIIDEIGQCYPKKLVNCETLNAVDCIANSHCCLREECADNPQIVECPAKTIQDCQQSEECRVIDNGSCSGQIFNCNISKEQCINSSSFCQWTSNIIHSCDNKVHCDKLEFDECWDYCEECDWHKDACKHHP